MPTKPLKSDERTDALLRLSVLSNASLTTISLAILKRIQKSGVLSEVKTVGLFYPFKSELNVIPIMQQYNAKFGLPKIVDFQNKVMHFAEWNHGDALVENKYGVFEPKKDVSVLPDALVVPIVAFCPNTLHRIGYGGGFYDRYFQKHPEIKKIGVALEMQKIQNKDLTFESTDVRLDMVFTEQNVYKI